MRAQFGKSIRPELGRLDYSGIARAAEIRAQSMSNLGQMVGQAITGYKKRKDDEKKIDMYATDLFKKLESNSPEDVRKLNLFGINQGTFGDFNDEEKLDSIKNTLKTFGIEGITALENSYRTTELKLQQDLERIKADQIDVSKITDTDLNTFDEIPSEQKLEELYKKGVRQIIVNGKKVPILPPEEEETKEESTRDPRGRLIKVPELEEPKVTIPKVKIRNNLRNPNFQ
jgi:hypothetical protein